MFWAILEPWWSFPTDALAGRTSLLGNLHSLHLPLWLLVLYMVVLGALVPFLLVVSALPRIGATRTAIVAMLELVVAVLVAWAWLGESLDRVQLVGAALTQRPDLFKAVDCEVPLLDMVRYHRFGSGRTWVSEYGSADNEADFRWLYAYSPYHHVTPGTAYPAVLMSSSEIQMACATLSRGLNTPSRDRCATRLRP